MPGSDERTFTQVKTLGRGNSGPNAFILSLVTPTKLSAIKDHYDFLYPDTPIEEHFAEFIKAVGEIARTNPITDEAGPRTISNWDEATKYLLDLRKQNPEKLQSALAPFIRHFVNTQSRVLKYYQDTIEPLKLSFMRVLKNPSLLDNLDNIDKLHETGDADDVFITHRFIAEKFKEILNDKELPTLRDKIFGIEKAVGPNNKEGLLDWWNDIGFLQYHEAMARQKDPHWFSEVDFRILADYFLVNIDIDTGYSHQRKNIVSNANGMVSRDLFSEEMIKQLVARKIIAKPENEDDFLFFLKLGENDVDAKKKVRALVGFASDNDDLEDYIADFKKDGLDDGDIGAIGLPVAWFVKPKPPNQDAIVEELLRVGLIKEGNGYYVYALNTEAEVRLQFLKTDDKLISNEFRNQFIQQMKEAADNFAIVGSPLPAKFAVDEELVEQLLQRSIIVEKNGEYFFNKPKNKILDLLNQIDREDENVAEFLEQWGKFYHQAPTVSLYNSDHLHFTSRLTVAEAKQLQEKEHRASEAHVAANKNSLFNQTRNLAKPEDYETELQRIILARTEIIARSASEGKDNDAGKTFGYFANEKFEGKEKMKKPDFYVTKPIAEHLDRLLARQKQLEELIEDKKITEKENAPKPKTK